MLVKVTRKHIREGVHGSPYSCPVALAIGFAEDLHVGCETARVGTTVFVLSGAAQRFIAAFDARGPKAVKPATFRLRPL